MEFDEFMAILRQIAEENPNTDTDEEKMEKMSREFDEVCGF